MNGRQALRWADVYAFAQATGTISPGDECQILFDMSRAYLAGLEHGEDSFAIPPYERGRDG